MAPNGDRLIGFGRKNTPGLRRGLQVIGDVPHLQFKIFDGTVPLVFLPDFFIREIQVRLLRDLH